jgi:hypothetical protein
MRVIRVSPVVAAIAFVTLAGACAEPFSPPPNSIGDGKIVTVTAPTSPDAGSKKATRLKPSMDPGHLK